MNIMAEKKRLADLVQAKEQDEEREQQERKESNSVVNKSPVSKIVSKDGAKDKQISAKVNMKMYNAFTKINKAQGISNNSALNMLIAKYVRENRVILDEDDIF